MLCIFDCPLLRATKQDLAAIPQSRSSLWSRCWMWCAACTDSRSPELPTKACFGYGACCSRKQCRRCDISHHACKVCQVHRIRMVFARMCIDHATLLCLGPWSHSARTTTPVIPVHPPSLRLLRLQRPEVHLSSYRECSYESRSLYAILLCR